MEQEREMFIEYIKNYDRRVPEINRKIEHSFRVSILSRLIASALSSEEVTRAGIIGVLHDIGRFEQFKNYHTFNDDISIDHGELGYQILKDMNYNDEVVLKAIRYHNKYQIPNDLTELEKLHCNIIRDADKLDNIDRNYEHTFNNQKVNPKLLMYFYEHQLIPNIEVKTPLDAALRELSFVFDINYEATINHILNTNMLEIKLNQLYMQTKDNNINIIKDCINNYINNRLEKKGEKIYGRIRQEI